VFLRSQLVLVLNPTNVFSPFVIQLSIVEMVVVPTPILIAPLLETCLPVFAMIVTLLMANVQNLILLSVRLWTASGDLGDLGRLALKLVEMEPKHRQELFKFKLSTEVLLALAQRLTSPSVTLNVAS